jgi:hypothetical protein
VYVSLGRMLLQNKYGLKKPRDFTVSEGHGYPLVYYNKCKMQFVNNGFNTLKLNGSTLIIEEM